MGTGSLVFLMNKREQKGFRTLSKKELYKKIVNCLLYAYRGHSRQQVSRQCIIQLAYLES